MGISRLYVIRCKTKGYWYVGIKNRLPWERLYEHDTGTGAAWTRKHGVDCMIFSAIVPQGMANTLENDMTAYLMSLFGWAYVRGGQHVRCKDDDRTVDFWLPLPFRTGSFSDILQLRSGRMSHFLPQFLGLVNMFREFRDSQYSHHLHAEAHTQALFRDTAQHQEHVPPAHLATCS